jgi:hypothetical protein
MRPETLWCSNQRRGRSNLWSYPPAVERLLRSATAGETVLQLFGGRSRWGTTLDIDAGLKPHVRGDAWMPPFLQDSFDVVILDPPYFHLNQQMKDALLRGAAFVARSRIYWFHTTWINANRSVLRRDRSWLVRVGDSCQCRCLIEFRIAEAPKTIPILNFTRGPAMRYNRWLDGQAALPLTEAV